MGGGSAPKGKSRTPYLIGAATSGVLEIGIFHPVDTVAKRLMSNKGKTAGRLGEVLFREHASKGLVGKWFSLYPGLNFAAAYKILQRTYKFSAQPILKDYVAANHSSVFVNAFGKKGGTDMMHAFSGMCVGLGEVALLPLDVLKIKAQVNPEVLKGRGVFKIFADEGIGNLYRGSGMTALRNMPGSFALFGATSVIYSWVFNTTKREASGFQMFVGSFCGGVASIAVSSPMDVIKTRIQNRAFDDPRSGLKLIGDAIKNEGFGAFFKGLVPKIGLIGPKLVFSWTVAQWLSNKLSETWDK